MSAITMLQLLIFFAAMLLILEPLRIRLSRRFPRLRK